MQQYPLLPATRAEVSAAGSTRPHDCTLEKALPCATDKGTTGVPTNRFAVLSEADEVQVTFRAGTFAAPAGTWQPAPVHAAATEQHAAAGGHTAAHEVDPLLEGLTLSNGVSDITRRVGHLNEQYDDDDDDDDEL